MMLLNVSDNVSVPSTSTPAGSQTGNVGLNHNVQPSVLLSFSQACTLRDELLWILQTISRHHSYMSNDDIHTLFKAMFPDSEHVKTFTCGRDKTAYIARFGIKRQLTTKINDESFVVMSDESML